MAKHWQVDPSGKEIEAFAWKTWEAANNEALAEHLVCVAILENGLKFIENQAGFGYIGGTWVTIEKALKKRGIPFKREWVKAHPWEVHQALVAHFMDFEKSYGGDMERVLRVWHRGSNWKHSEKSRADADKYARDWASVYNRLYQEKANFVQIPAIKECENDARNSASN